MSLHTTDIQSNRQIQVYRRFPAHITARIPVSGNQTLSPVQIVAQTSHETGYEVVAVSEILGVKANDIDSYLSVKIGDFVRSGSMLAERKRRFGRSKHITSPAEGTVAEIVDGNLFITRTPEELNLRSLIYGKVRQVISGKGVIIQATGSRFQAAWSNGVEGAGNLRLLGQTATESVEIEQFDVDLYGAIVAVGHFDKPNLLGNLVDAGATGLIAGTVSADVFQAAKTWQLPFILTDGVGSSGMFHDIYELLYVNNGNHTALFGRDYGRSQRPEVVIVDQNQPEASEPDSNQLENQPAILKEKQPVRLLAGVDKGRRGIIKKIHKWPKTMATGVKTTGVDVEFENREIAFVPTANLDIIC